MSQINNPYVRGLAKEIFDAAVHGTTREKIEAKIKKADVTPQRIWRELKLEDFRGVKWSYSEDEAGNVKITVKARKVEKPSKKAAAEVEHTPPAPKKTKKAKEPKPTAETATVQ